MSNKHFIKVFYQGEYQIAVNYQYMYGTKAPWLLTFATLLRNDGVPVSKTLAFNDRVSCFAAFNATNERTVADIFPELIKADFDLQNELKARGSKLLGQS